MCPHTWRVPKDLSGEFQVLPKLDTGPFESKLLPQTIRLKDGIAVPREELDAKLGGAAGAAPATRPETP
jgi:hypothetical protein